MGACDCRRFPPRCRCRWRNRNRDHAPHTGPVPHAVRGLVERVLSASRRCAKASSSPRRSARDWALARLGGNPECQRSPRPTRERSRGNDPDRRQVVRDRIASSSRSRQRQRQRQPFRWRVTDNECRWRQRPASTARGTSVHRINFPAAGMSKLRNTRNGLVHEPFVPGVHRQAGSSHSLTRSRRLPFSRLSRVSWFLPFGQSIAPSSRRTQDFRPRPGGLFPASPVAEVVRLPVAGGCPVTTPFPAPARDPPPAGTLTSSATFPARGGGNCPVGVAVTAGLLHGVSAGALDGD